MNNTQLIQLSVLVVIIFVLVAFANNIEAAIRRLLGNEKEPEFGDTPVPPGTVDADFDPLFYVTRLWDELNGIAIDGSPRCQAYRELMDTNDTEFVIVTNQFLATTGRSLRSMMNDTWHSGCSFFGIQWDDRVIARMRQLNVRG